MPYVKGQSGNPNGRPRFRLPDGRTLRDVCRDHTESAVNALISIAENAQAPEGARVAAINSILDRGWGKAPQPVVGGDEEDPPIQHELNVKGLSTEALREIAALGG
jgi:hypothetical protein